MAIVRIWPIKSRMDHAIDYASNPEKTIANDEASVSFDTSVTVHQGIVLDGGRTDDITDDLTNVLGYATNEDKTERLHFVTGINCNARRAKKEFTATKKRYRKEGGILAYHVIQSFAPGEATPDQVHQMGIDFTKEAWGADYQVVVATHLNTDSCHNHFVVNSVSHSHGKRLRATKWYELKNISDEVCKGNGLQTIDLPSGKRMPYKVAVAERNGEPTRLVMAREAVDEAIGKSLNMKEFQYHLHSMGFICQFDSNRKY